MREEVQHSIIWGAVVAVVSIVIGSTMLIGASFESRFDTNCIDNGKSLEYQTYVGADYAKKVCK